MSKKKESTSFFFKLYILVIIFVALIGLTLIFYPGTKKMHHIMLQEEEIDQKTIEHEKKLRELKEKQKALVQDPEYLEKVARDKLGYSGSDEIIYRFNDEGQKQE